MGVYVFAAYSVGEYFDFSNKILHVYPKIRLVDNYIEQKDEITAVKLKLPSVRTVISAYQSQPAGKV